MPVDTLARLFKLTPRRIQQLAAEGVIPRGQRGKYAFVPCIQAYIEHLRTQVDAIQRATAALDSSDAATRLKTAQARLAELELDRQEGKLVAVHDAAEAVEQRLSALRSQLVTLPQRVAPVVLGCKTLAEVTAKLDAAVAEAMTSIAEGA